jgi:hypothetical protein
MVSTRDLKDMRGRAFRDEYLQNWSVSVDQDYSDLHDPYGNIINRMPRGAPKVSMEFRGKPVTIQDILHKDAKRIAIWMPGEAMRTRPLLEEEFTAERFYETAKEAMTRASMRSPMFGSGSLGLTEAFMIAWAEENYHAILKAEDERERSGWLGGPWALPDDPVDVRHFRGEDGRTYAELKPNKAAEQRRLQSELEDLPGFGSF